MEFLTMSWIESRAANPAVFNRACAFKKKAQIEVEIYPDQLIKGTTTDGEEVCHVTLTLSQEDQIKATCDCGSFHIKFGACKHIVAILLTIYDQQKKQPALMTSQPIAQLIEAYRPQFQTTSMAELTALLQDFKTAPLVTTFYLDAATPSQILLQIKFSYDDGRPPYLLRDTQKETDTLTAVTSYGFTRAGDNHYQLQNEAQIYRFIKEGIAALNQLGAVYTASAIKKINIQTATSLRMGVRVENNLLQVDFDELDFDKNEYHQILAAYRAKKHYYRLKDGSFFSFEDGASKKVFSFLEDLKLSVKDEAPSYKAFYLDQFAKLNPEITLNPHLSFEKMISTFQELSQTEVEIPYALASTLRSYQKTGYRWLKTLAHYGFGGILADDMGLGKTLQVITLILSDPAKTSLVVTPSSLMYNWQREIERFAPELKVLIINGEPESRQLAIKQCQQYQVIITSYDLVRRDLQFYLNQTFRYLVLDEAQYIKNQGTRNAKSVKQINSDVRFALTGTPIENSLADLWSIFDFILPGYLGSYRRFREKYEIPILKAGQTKLLEQIHQQVAPFILRRLKRQVLQELPEKIETSLYCEMEPEQEKLYFATLYQAQQTLNQESRSTGFAQNRMRILTYLMRLRQLCCHPRLYLENYQGESAKLKLCLQLVESSIAANHKILIFSQFTSMLEILARELRHEKIPYYVLTGATPSKERLELTEQFNQDSTPVFLISLRAGGTGLNLTGADVIIHYDPWWNMSVQNQATDRAHRIGQEKSVQVFKLITKQTIEEKIEQLQQRKRALSEAVIKEGETFINRLSEAEIMDLFNNQ